MENQKSQTCTVVIPCKGRLSHLRECLPMVLSMTGVELQAVIVDYACPDQCGDWAESLADPRVKVVRVDAGPEEWNLSAARNAGAVASGHCLLCFIDADNRPPASWLRDSIDTWRPGHYLVASDNSTFILRRADFEAAGGWNEALIHGWGWEDIDLCRRLSGACIARQVVGPVFPIPHTDADRNRFAGGRPKAQTLLANQCVTSFVGIRRKDEG